MLISRCSNLSPGVANNPTSPGMLLRAVKLLPMNNTLREAGFFMCIFLSWRPEPGYTRYARAVPRDAELRPLASHSDLRAPLRFAISRSVAVFSASVQNHEEY